LSGGSLTTEHAPRPQSFGFVKPFGSNASGVRLAIGRLKGEGKALGGSKVR
jgi:hypothetical protein